jgi:hypothetical protein
MAAVETLTAERVREVLAYDPEAHLAYARRAKDIYGDFARTE